MGEQAQRHQAEKEAEKSSKVVALLRTMLQGEDASHYVRGKDFTMQQMLEAFEASLGDTLDELPEVQAEIEDIILGAYGGLGVQRGRERHLEKKLAAFVKIHGSNDLRVANILLDLSGSYPQPGSKGLSQGNALLDEAIRIVKTNAPESADYARALWTRGFYSLLDGRRRHAKEDLDHAHRMDEKARAEAAELLKIQPKFSLEQLEKRLTYKRDEDRDRVLGASRKAGLK